jgi:hypothetical protein
MRPPAVAASAARAEDRYEGSRKFAIAANVAPNT